MKEKDIEFTEGFMKNLADMLNFCKENNTDTIEIEFAINGNKLVVEMTFKVE